MNARPLLAAGLSAGLLLGAPPPARASDDSYFLGRGLVSGGYGAPVMKASTLGGAGVVLAGGEAGWILARSLVLGGAGYATITHVVSPGSLQSTAGDARLGMGYGGLRAAAIFLDDWRLHGVFGVLVGGGSAWSENDHVTVRHVDGFLVIEPELDAEVNVTDNVRVALGGGYRFVASSEESGFSSRRLSGPAVLAAIRLGVF